MPEQPTNRAPEWRRAAAVAILLAVAALGLRVGWPPVSTKPLGGQRVGDVITVPVAALIVVGVVLIVTAMAVTISRRRRRRPEDEQVIEEPPSPWWSRPVALLIALAAMAAPIAALLYIIRNADRGAMSAPIATSSVPSAAHPSSPAFQPPATGGSQGGWAWIFLVLGLIALGLLIVASRRRAASAATEAPARLAAVVEGATTAGEAALRGSSDGPRQAIIACYAAMERHLAATDAEPRASDTPAEVLARAASVGAVDPAAAQRLTGLFREARYSRHPMDESDRTAALQALTALRHVPSEAR